MSESLVEAPKVENKMGESVTNVPCFEQSVSFGRFEHDSLCWERWSTFPTNKYLEEVEKCSTPGSVAQKKAYFEAHYKKIAARKAELLQDQETKRETESVGLEDRTPIDSGSNVSEEGFGNETAGTQEFVNETDQLEDEVYCFTSEACVSDVGMESGGADIIDQVEVTNFSGNVSEHIDEMNHRNFRVNEIREMANLASEVNEHIGELNDGAQVVDEVVKSEVVEQIGKLYGGTDNTDEIVKSEVTEHVYEPHDVADMIKESYDIQREAEHGSEDLRLKMKIPELENAKESVLLTDDLSFVQEFQDKEVLPQKKVERKIAEKETKDSVELVCPKKPQKAPFVKNTSSSTNAKKKLASTVLKRSTASMSKSLMLSTPNSSKPELSKPAKSASRPSIEKENRSVPLTGKRTTRSGGKRTFPTSLHMSLSLEPGNSGSASLSTTRKSSIMESMGDKDIVKRAFKAFQNVTLPAARNQFASGKVERKGSTSDNLRNKTERIVRTTNTSSTPTGQHGTKKSVLSTGFKKNVRVEGRTATSVAASFGPRVQLQGNKLKEVTKKLEFNTKTNDRETINLQSKVKVEKPAQIRRPTQTINSKPKLSSSYNQEHGFFRGSVHKEDAKVQASG